MLKAALARHQPLELLEQVCSDVGVPVFRDDYRGGGVRHEQVAEAIDQADGRQGPIYFDGDIEQSNPLGSFDFEFIHVSEFTLDTGSFP